MKKVRQCVCMIVVMMIVGHYFPISVQALTLIKESETDKVGEVFYTVPFEKDEENEENEEKSKENDGQEDVLKKEMGKVLKGIEEEYSVQQPLLLLSWEEDELSEKTYYPILVKGNVIELVKHQKETNKFTRETSSVVSSIREYNGSADQEVPMILIETAEQVIGKSGNETVNFTSPKMTKEKTEELIAGIDLAAYLQKKSINMYDDKNVLFNDKLEKTTEESNTSISESTTDTTETKKTTETTETTDNYQTTPLISDTSKEVTHPSKELESEAVSIPVEGENEKTSNSTSKLEETTSSSSENLTKNDSQYDRSGLEIKSPFFNKAVHSLGNSVPPFVSNPKELNLNQEHKGKLIEFEEKTYYQFDAPEYEKGTAYEDYTLTLSSDIRVVATVYASDGKPAASLSTSGIEGREFNLSNQLTPGRYYLEMKAYYSFELGNFKVKMNRNIARDDNYDFSTAVHLPFNKDYQAKLDFGHWSYGGDKDYYRIEVPEPEVGTVYEGYWIYAISDFGNGEYYRTVGTLYDSDGKSIKPSRTNRPNSKHGDFIIYQLLEPGVYYLEVKSSFASLTDYTIRVDREIARDDNYDFSTAVQLPFNKDHQAKLDFRDSYIETPTYQGDTDYYRIDIPEPKVGTAYDIYRIYAISDFGSRGTLYDSEGKVITKSSYNSPHGSFYDFGMDKLLEPGVYYLEVKADSASSTGNYTVRVDRETARDDNYDFSTAVHLPLNKEYQAKIDFGKPNITSSINEGDKDYYRIDIPIPKAGTTYEIYHIYATSDLKYYGSAGNLGNGTSGTLFDSDGKKITYSSHHSPHGKIDDLGMKERLEPGVYYLEVKADNVTGTGNYTVQVDRETARDDNYDFSTAVHLPLNKEHQAKLDFGHSSYGGDKDYYKVVIPDALPLKEEEYEFVGVGNVGIYSLLYDHEGKLLSSTANSSSDTPTIINRKLTPGVYYLEIKGTYQHAVGDYTVRVMRKNKEKPPVIRVNNTTTGTIKADDDQRTKLYEFFISDKPETVIFREHLLEFQADFGGTATLLDRNQQVVATVNHYGQLQPATHQQILKQGHYYLKVETVGNFKVNVKQLDKGNDGNRSFEKGRPLLSQRTVEEKIDFGESGKYHDEDFFKLKILNFSSSNNYELKLSGDTAVVGKLYTDKKEPMSGEFTSNLTTSLLPGTYYLKVKGKKVETLGYYTVSLQNKEDFGQANKIEPNKLVSGKLTEKNGSTYYKIKLNKTEKMQFELKNSKPIKFELFDSNEKKITAQSMEVGSNAQLRKIKYKREEFEPGTYYIKISGQQPTDYELIVRTALKLPVITVMDHDFLIKGPSFFNGASLFELENSIKLDYDFGKLFQMATDKETAFWDILADGQSGKLGVTMDEHNELIRVDFPNSPLVEEKLKSSNKLPLIETELGINGFVEMNTTTGELLRTGIEGAASAKQEFPLPIPGSMPWLKVNGSIEAEGGASIYASNNQKAQMELESEFELTGKLGAGVVAGAHGVFGVEVGLKGGLTGGAAFSEVNKAPEDIFSASISAEAYAKATAFLFELEESLKLVEVQIYPTAQTRTVVKKQGGDFQLASRSVTKMRRSEAIKPSVNQKNVYQNGKPTVVKLLDGRLMSVWLFDDGTQTSANRTQLVYSIKTDESWSEPRAVMETIGANPLADFDPQVVSNDGNVHILWKKATRAFNSTVTLDDMLNQVDLMYTVFDGEEFTTPTKLRKSGEFGMLTDLAVNRNETTISWSVNSEGDKYGIEGENTLYSQTINQGKVNEPKVIATNVKRISGLKTGYVNNKITHLYVTNNDSFTESYVYKVGSGLLPSKGKTNGDIQYMNQQFYWLSDGTVMQYDASRNPQSTGITAEGGYRMLSNGGKDAIVWKQMDGFHSELMIMNFEGERHATKLTNYQRAIRDFDAVLDDKNQVVATALLSDVDETKLEKGQSPFGTTDLVTESFGTYYDVSLSEKLTIDEKALSEKQAVTIKGEVMNNSSEAIDAYQLRLEDEQGNVLQEKVYKECLQSGATKEVSMTYQPDYGKTLPSLKLYVGLLEKKDRNEADNYRAVNFSVDNLILKEKESSLKEDGSVEITVLVNNQSGKTVKGSVLTVTDDANEQQILMEEKLTQLEAGEEKECVLTLPKGDNLLEGYRVKLKSDLKETTYLDNQVKVTVDKMNVLPTQA